MTDTLAPSDRKATLDWYESFWRAVEYDGREHDYLGRKFGKGPARRIEGPWYEADAEASVRSVPMASRKPASPSRLGRTIVTRFTDALYADGKAPSIVVKGDSTTNEFLEGIRLAGAYWPSWVETRNVGGALGSVLRTFAFHDGVPVFEVHNPKYVSIQWGDRATGRILAVDITYQYPVEERSRRGWVTRWYWYRRRIDTRADTVFKPLEASADPSSGWDIETEVVHGLGFFPGVWIQNTRCSDTIDGEPDCYGQFEAIQEYDALKSLASAGLLPNADPTLVIATTKRVGEVRKGSGNAIILNPSESATYLTLSGEAAAACISTAKALKEDICQALSVVLEGTDSGAQGGATATEIRHRYRSFFERTDSFRAQYGAAMKTEAELLLAAARRLMEPVAPAAEGDDVPLTTLDTEIALGLLNDVDADVPSTFTNGIEGGVTLYRQVLKLPPKLSDDDGDPDTPATLRQRELGPGGIVDVSWPEHIALTPVEIQTLVAGLVAAREAGFIDQNGAATAFLQAFGVRDTAATIAKATAEKEARAAEAAAKFQAAMAASGPQFSEERP